MVETGTDDSTPQETEALVRVLELDSDVLAACLEGHIVESLVDGDFYETVEIVGVPPKQRITVTVRRYRFPKGEVKTLSLSPDENDRELAEFMEANNARPDWASE